MKKFTFLVIFIAFVSAAYSRADTLAKSEPAKMKLLVDTADSVKFDIGIHPTKPKPEPETPLEERRRRSKESAPIGMALFVITLFALLILGKKKTK